MTGVALIGDVSKTFVSREKLAKNSGGVWNERVSIVLVRVFGVLELLDAVGLATYPALMPMIER